MPQLALIAAVARNGVIGSNGTLPWRFPEDLRRFRNLTTGHALIMGRRTWDSLPRALPGRENIVITRQPRFAADGAIIAHSLDDALAKVTQPPPVYCIGGGEIFREAMPLATTAYMTEIDADFEGDAVLPPLDRDEWRETRRESHPFDAARGFAYAFVTYERVSSAAP
jgi:dihydrofolate reductase